MNTYEYVLNEQNVHDGLKIILDTITVNIFNSDKYNKAELLEIVIRLHVMVLDFATEDLEITDRMDGIQFHVTRFNDILEAWKASNSIQ